MPRRTPGAIRAARTPDRGREVHAAIALYRRALRQPGRYLRLDWHFPGPWDPEEARDALEHELAALTPRQRRRFLRFVEPLDEEFRRRTLPNPYAAATNDWFAGAWWRQRVREW